MSLAVIFFELEYFYRLFCRVKLRKVTAASAIPVASVSRLGSTADNLGNVAEVGQEAIEMGRVGRPGQSMYFYRAKWPQCIVYRLTRVH